MKSNGSEHDDIVLCIRTETFTCKHVQTTNSLLLCDVTEVCKELVLFYLITPETVKIFKST
jgi:hypothetical protein